MSKCGIRVGKYTYVDLPRLYRKNPTFFVCLRVDVPATSVRLAAADLVRYQPHAATLDRASETVCRTAALSAAARVQRNRQQRSPRNLPTGFLRHAARVQGESTEGAAAARLLRPRRGRYGRHTPYDRAGPGRLRALRFRAGGDAGDRIHRRAGQVPARPGPAERRRVLVPGRRRAVAFAALRPHGATRPLRGRELRHPPQALPQLPLRLGVPQREARPRPLPPVYAV